MADPLPTKESSEEVIFLRRMKKKDILSKIFKYTKDFYQIDTMRQIKVMVPSVLEGLMQKDREKIGIPIPQSFRDPTRSYSGLLKPPTSALKSRIKTSSSNKSFPTAIS